MVPSETSRTRSSTCTPRTTNLLFSLQDVSWEPLTRVSSHSLEGSSTHHLPNVFSCTLIQLCSSTAMANTHARWVLWAVSSSRSAGELLEGFLPLACLLPNRHVSRRRLMQIFNQSAPKVNGKSNNDIKR